MSLFSFFNNKDKINDNDFYLHPLWPYLHPFFIYCYIKRLCLYKREISLTVMLKQLQNRKTNTTKNPSSLCNDCLCLRCTSAPLSSSFTLITDGRVVLKKIPEKYVLLFVYFPLKVCDLVNFMQIVLFSMYQYQTLDD